MTVKFRTGDILGADVDVEALVNTVNCVGIMGRGIALQFKNTFPDNYKAYAAACKREQVKPGRMFVFETGRLMPKYIINFPTKRHWKGKSRIEDIQSGLEDLVREIRTRNIRSIAVPPLGSGLGGLEWKRVRPLIVDALGQIEGLRVIVFEPSALTDPKAGARSGDAPPMTPGRAALVVLMHRYLGGLMDPFITLLELHKLLYFMQEAGEDLRLSYAKASFGPYAENLRHVLAKIEGYMVSGYADGGDAPNKQIELVPGAVDDAEKFLRTQAETRRRFDRVADLVEGFETPFGLELLATVHWLATRDGATTADDIAKSFYSWSQRKKRFTPRQIGIAHDVLRTKGWLTSPGRRVAPMSS
jgi:O-acetyl-ADP-ribose deacetylase (regulator of RNase III)